MAKTRKVMDVAEGGKHFAIILQEGTEIPYHVYRYEWKWKEWKNCEGGHWSESRKLIQKCTDMRTALLLIAGQY